MKTNLEQNGTWHEYCMWIYRKSFQICWCLLLKSNYSGFLGPLQPAKYATDRVYNKSTSTLWYFISLHSKSNEAPIDSLHWFNLASPVWNTALLSDENLCVYILDVDIQYLWCGGGSYMGWASVGLAAYPWDCCTAETSRLCLQYLSTSSQLPTHFQQDLMGPSCPRSLRLYRPQWDNNSASYKCCPNWNPLIIELALLLACGWISLGHVVHFGNYWTLFGWILVDYRALSCAWHHWIKILAWQVQMHDSFL